MKLFHGRSHNRSWMTTCFMPLLIFMLQGNTGCSGDTWSTYAKVVKLTNCYQCQLSPSEMPLHNKQRVGIIALLPPSEYLLFFQIVIIKIIDLTSDQSFSGCLVYVQKLTFTLPFWNISILHFGSCQNAYLINQSSKMPRAVDSGLVTAGT